MDLILFVSLLLFTTCLASHIHRIEWTAESASRNLTLCEAGWHASGNSCYKLHGQILQERRSWAEASYHCTELGGKLASVHSEEENEFLSKLVLNDFNHFTWIGLHYLKEESYASWEGESLLNTEDWPTEESSGEELTNENCVGLIFDPLLEITEHRNDGRCENRHPYICQKSMSEVTSPNPSHVNVNTVVPITAKPNSKRKSKEKNKHKHQKVVTYRNFSSLLKSSENISVGTLAFVLDDESLLVRVKKGWKYLKLSKLIHVQAPIATVSPISESSKDLPVTTEQMENIPSITPIFPSFHTPTSVSTEPPKNIPSLRMAALNQPTTGYMNGIRSVDNECNRQAFSAGLKGNFNAFLASRHRNISDIVKQEYSHLPVINLKGNILYSSWNDVFDGMGGLTLESLEIYSFEGKNVLEHKDWPNKIIWHGSNYFGSPALEFHCDFWQSNSSDKAGMSSFIAQNLLLYQAIHTCDNLFIVLCIQTTM